MPRYFARSSGNFDNPIRWSLTPAGVGGAGIPTVGDEAVANSFTVTISADATCDLVRNDTVGGATAGGFFNMGNDVTFSTNVTGAAGGSPTVIQYSGLLRATIVGNLTASTTFAGCAINNSIGTLNIFGDLRGSGNAPAAQNSSSGILNIVGTVIGGAGNVVAGVRNNSTGIINLTGTAIGGVGLLTHGIGGFGNGGTINVFGNCIGGSGTSAGGVGLGTGSGATGGDVAAHSVNIFGNAIGGTLATAPGVFNNFRGGIITVYGVASASSLAPGATNNSSGTLYVVKATGNRAGRGGTGTPNVGASNASFGTMYVEELEYGPFGQTPVAGPVFIVHRNNTTINALLSSLTPITFFTSLSTTNLLPPVSSVRQGTIYNLGTNAGTMVVPSVSAVEADVTVDNSAGIAALNNLDILNVPLSSLTIANNFGDASKNAVTIQTVGGIVASYNS